MFRRVLNNLMRESSGIKKSCRGLHDSKLPSVTPCFEVPSGKLIGRSSELKDDTIIINKEKKHYERNDKLWKPYIVRSFINKKIAHKNSLFRTDIWNDRED